jgi:hypothetical protein
MMFRGPVTHSGKVEASVSQTLTTIESDRMPVCRLVLQIALSDRTPPAKAVLRSILALSSLYRNGNQTHAAQLKLSALQSLMASTETGIGSTESVQHVVAAMLLCSFEVRIDGSVRFVC